MSEFEKFLNETMTDAAAIRKQKSDEFQDRVTRANEAAKLTVQSIINAFASDDRFGGYFKPHDNPQGQILNDRFEFTMAGKELVLSFTGRVAATTASPTGYAPVAAFKVARRSSSTATSSDHNVQLEVKTNGAIIPVGLYEIVKSATASFIKNNT